MAIEQSSLDAAVGSLKARMAPGAAEMMDEDLEGVAYLFALLTLAEHKVRTVEFGTTALVYADDWVPRKLRPARRVEIVYETKDQAIESVRVECDEEEDIGYWVFDQFGQKDSKKQEIVSLALRLYSDYCEARARE